MNPTGYIYIKGLRAGSWGLGVGSSGIGSGDGTGIGGAKNQARGCHVKVR